ncbi:hypothetical protein ACFO3J_03230 [Streptomyces polygonati]|uniref:Uncharacterized protein n=1 Tax=Streptomyces polygonati TaxID=1617087 RepID=A0ABV8HEX9_9ACTN
MAELPERLREAAEAHRPDRARMLARVERAMDPPGRPGDGRGDRKPAPWMRIAAVTAAVAGALGIGGLAVGAVSTDSEPGQTAVTSGGSTAPRPRPAATTTPLPAAGHRGAADRHSGAPARHRADAAHAPGSAYVPGSARTPPSPAAPPTTPTGTPSAHATTAGVPPASTPATQGAATTSAGTLDAASTTSWSQSDVSVTTHQELTALTVELRVARTGGVASTGSFSSIPGKTLASIEVEGDHLVYRWTLGPDQTLEANTYTFAGQFNHAVGGRDTSGDGYTVAAVGKDGPVALSGGF